MCRAARRGRDPRLRLEAVRGRADRHPQPRRRARRRGVAPAQHRVPRRERCGRRGGAGACRGRRGRRGGRVGVPTAGSACDQRRAPPATRPGRDAIGTAASTNSATSSGARRRARSVGERGQHGHEPGDRRERPHQPARPGAAAPRRSRRATAEQPERTTALAIHSHASRPSFPMPSNGLKKPQLLPTRASTTSGSSSSMVAEVQGPGVARLGERHALVPVRAGTPPRSTPSPTRRSRVRSRSSGSSRRRARESTLSLNSTGTLEGREVADRPRRDRRDRDDAHHARSGRRGPRRRRDADCAGRSGWRARQQQQLGAVVASERQRHAGERRRPRRSAGPRAGTARAGRARTSAPAGSPTATARCTARRSAPPRTGTRRRARRVVRPRVGRAAR